MLIGGLMLAGLLVFISSDVAGLSANRNTDGEHQQKRDIPLPSLEDALGQSFVVGISHKTLDTDTRIFLEKLKPAGIILYYRNYETPDQLKNLIDELQQIAKATTNGRYFIMLDEEPGGATRLNFFKNVFDSGMPAWDRIEQDIKSMASIGINVDLAPLADFPFNENSFIKKRIPAHSTKALVDFNKRFVALLQKHEVSATLKHFPGMGVFVDDPHAKLPVTSDSSRIIDRSIQLFKSGIDSGAHFVMTGHAVYDAIDPGIPATLSKKITTDMLRGDLGFQGLIITDDLSDMPFVIGKNIDRAKAAIGALEAGHNLVLFSHGPERTKDIFETLLVRAQSDQQFKMLIEDNYRTTVLFKQKRFLNLTQ